MSNTKQCACCDLHYDPYELDTVSQYLVCEDCIDGCPTENNGTMICNISGRAAKPAVEQAIAQFMGSNGAGGLPPGAPIPGSAQTIQSVQQFIQQIGAGGQWNGPGPNLIGGPPAASTCSQCQHDKAARGCACSHCHCGCASCAGSGQQDAGTNGATALSPCPDCEGTGASRKPKPPPKFVTKTQGVTFDSALERMKLQLKAGLNDEGRPLRDDERKALERQVQIREPSEEDEARELLESELGTYDAEMRALLGVED